MVGEMARFEQLTADLMILSSDLSGRSMYRGTSGLSLEPASAYCGSDDVRPHFLSCKNLMG